MVSTFLTPGVSFRRADPPPAAAAQRTDVAGFVGLAERGPLHEPRRVTTFREFQHVFGGFLPYAALAYAVRAFFANGGDACWVVRVAATAATDDPAAEPDLSVAGTASAPLPARPDLPLLPDQEAAVTAFTIAASSPGTWGNGLLVQVEADPLAPTQDVAASGLDLATKQLAVGSLVGFEAGSWVQLTQRLGSSPASLVAKVTGVDAVTSALTFAEVVDAAAAQFVLASTATIRVESLEFQLTVFHANQLEERFAGLAPDADHSRAADRIVNGTSRLVELCRGDGAGVPVRPHRLTLAGGRNGLRGLNLYDYIGTPWGDRYGLAALAEIDEVGILAMPDLTARPQIMEPVRRARRRAVVDECATPSEVVPVQITGTIIDAETERPLNQVTIALDDRCLLDAAGQQQLFAGEFTLPPVSPGRHDLTFCLAGYETLTKRIDVSAVGNEHLTIALSPLDRPPVLTDTEIALGQAAMIEQCTRLRDRFAVLDPPLATGGGAAMGEDPCSILCETCPVDEAAAPRPATNAGQLDIGELRSWRSRFDTDFAALYYPWLIVPDPLQPGAPAGRLVPPCGHVAGVYAATDRAEGAHRAPANRALVGVDDVAVAIDDALQGVLNPAGINAIRSFPGRGVRLFGARTMSSEAAKRFVNVRRLLNLLIEAMEDGLQWAVFEPNDRQLRLGVRLSLLTLLDGLWRRGAFVGDTADAAYRVRCDALTTPPEVAALGRLIAEVEVAPTVPYEFIVVRLGITADELRVTEA